MTFTDDIGYPELNAGRSLYHIFEARTSNILTGLQILWPCLDSGFITASAIGLTLISPVNVGLTRRIEFAQR